MVPLLLVYEEYRLLLVRYAEMDGISREIIKCGVSSFSKCVRISILTC